MSSKIIHQVHFSTAVFENITFSHIFRNQEYFGIMISDSGMLFYKTVVMYRIYEYLHTVLVFKIFGIWRSWIFILVKMNNAADDTNNIH